MKRISLKKLSPLLAAVPAALLLFSGCGKQAATSDTDSTAANKGKIRLAYVNWSEGVAVTHLFASLLDDMGYEVETTMADVAPIYVSVAEGKQDVMVETWLPTTHKAYAEQYGSRLETVSTWFEGAKIGLVVPDYVEINSIDELNAAKDKFKGKIIGVDAGAGIMGSTDQAIKDYALDFELISSSGPAMTAALKSAIDKKEWIAVTGWAPHWKFARFDLKFLEDPKTVYGGAERIEAVSRIGFAKDFPEVADVLGRIKFTTAEIGSLMAKMEEANGKDKQAVREWIAENQALVDGWLNK